MRNKPYSVNVLELHVITIEVDATSPEEARKKAATRHRNGEFNHETIQFDRLSVPETWQVTADNTGKIYPGNPAI